MNTKIDMMEQQIAELQRETRLAEAQAIFKQRGVPAELAELIDIAGNAETVRNSIIALSDLFLKEVRIAAERKAPQSDAAKRSEELRDCSEAEMRDTIKTMNLTQLRALYETSPELFDKLDRSEGVKIPANEAEYNSMSLKQQMELAQTNPAVFESFSGYSISL